MSRKLYPSEARKIREMLGEDFTDFEISRALHVAHATVSNIRNEDQNDVEKIDTESPLEPEKKEMDHGTTTLKRIPKKNQRESNDLDRNPSVTESEGSTEDPEPKTITYVGGRKHKEPEEEEFECECLECGGLFNGERERCPHCGTELELAGYEEQTEDNEETTDSENEDSSKEENNDDDDDECECQKCGALVEPEDEYCPKCGYGPLDWD